MDKVHICKVCGEEHHIYGMLDLMSETVAQVAERRLKLLRRVNEFLKHAPEFPYRLVVEYDIEDLQDEIAEELATQ